MRVVSTSVVTFKDKRTDKVQTKKVILRPGTPEDMAARAQQALAPTRGGAKNVVILAINGQEVANPEAPVEAEAVPAHVTMPTIDQIIEGSKKELVAIVSYFRDIPQFRDYFSEIKLSWSKEHLQDVIMARLYPAEGQEVPALPAAPAT